MDHSVSQSVSKAHIREENEKDDAHMLHETLHIASTEELGDARLGGEPFEVVEVFSRSEEDDGSFGGGDAEWNKRTNEKEEKKGKRFSSEGERRARGNDSAG
jgi:hypothetical protein